MKPKRILILEGCDGTGKSTLARAVCERYDAHYVHVGPPPDPKRALKWYYDLLAVALQHPRVVFDRFHFGSYAYGLMYRDGPDLKINDHRALEFSLDSAGCSLVLCDAGTRWIQTQLNTRGERTEYEDAEKIFDIREAMNVCFIKCRLPSILYCPDMTPYYRDVFNFVERTNLWTPTP